MEQRKYISILGDDRSTFEGVTPKIGSFYSPSYVSYAGFATPEGTWWMQLIHRLGAPLQYSMQRGGGVCSILFPPQYRKYWSLRNIHAYSIGTSASVRRRIVYALDSFSICIFFIAI